MEHYKKKQSMYYEDPCQANEVRVGGEGKPRDLCARAGGFLKAESGGGVYISGVGGHVTKAVTVVELIKKKFPGLHQDTTIKYARVEDMWEPDEEGLDRIKVTRKIPFISVHLMIKPDEKLDTEDILHSIDQHEKVEAGKVGHYGKSPRKWTANPEASFDEPTQSVLISGLKLDEVGKGSCAKETQHKEGSGSGRRKRRSGHSSRGAGGVKKSPGEKEKSQSQTKSRMSPKT